MPFITDVIGKYEEEAKQKIKEAREHNARNRPKQSIFFESPRKKQAKAEVKSYSPRGTSGGTDGVFLNSPIPACENTQPNPSAAVPQENPDEGAPEQTIMIPTGIDTSTKEPTEQNYAYFEYQNRIIEFYKHVKNAAVIATELENCTSILQELDRLKQENAELKDQVNQLKE